MVYAVFGNLVVYVSPVLFFSRGVYIFKNFGDPAQDIGELYRFVSSDFVIHYNIQPKKLSAGSEFHKTIDRTAGYPACLIDFVDQGCIHPIDGQVL